MFREDGQTDMTKQTVAFRNANIFIQCSMISEEKLFFWNVHEFRLFALLVTEICMKVSMWHWCDDTDGGKPCANTALFTTNLT